MSQNTSGTPGLDLPESIRALVCKDHAKEAKTRLLALIEEGIASGPGRPLTPADEGELLAIARGEIE